MTYYINLENTGLETDEQVKYMAEAMQNDGHDVEFTRDFGAVNTMKLKDIGITDDQWFAYVESADANA